MSDPMNWQIAGRLEEAAHLLHEHDTDPFRVRAYMHAAASVRGWPESLARIYRDGGIEALEELPAVGPSIARAIRELITRGRLPMLDRLRAASDAATVLASVPGIGRELARRLHDELGIATLEDLETAAHDGRLAGIAGFGEKRLTGIRDSLAQRLGRLAPSTVSTGKAPSVAELLDVDSEYREKAAAGALPQIAPRRFNPAGKAWLPVLHTQRAARRYTALYSNTAHAHRLQKTHDWVVLSCGDGADRQQFTVITAAYGPLRGQRVVAGREHECVAVAARTAA